MRDMISRVPDWFHKVDEHPMSIPPISEDPETDRAFADFQTDTSDPPDSSSASTHALNEGIHVPDIDGSNLLNADRQPHRLWKQ